MENDAAYCSQDITKLARALIEVQKSLQPAIKDASNPFCKSRYATLNSVMDSCREKLISNGIWLTQYPIPVDQPNCLGLVTKLTHAESGQYQSSLAVVPLPKLDPQGVGICITYMRRYALSAMLGIVTEEDTDGEFEKPEQMQPIKQKNHKQETNNHASSLPALDGITYKSVTSHDGNICIIAEGDTRPKKQFLIAAGFRWNPERKVWWKYADAV